MQDSTFFSAVARRGRVWRATGRGLFVAAAVALTISGSGLAFAEPGSGGRAVRVPQGYEYNPNGPRKQIHDYCSYSGNGHNGENQVKWPSPTDADFRGACAVHDKCYEHAQDNNVLEECDNQLSRDLEAECEAAFSGKKLEYCLARRDVMMAGVRLADWRPWPFN
ncbi:hypothetical protein [Nocardia goodfellowii]|uniref:Phospholipase A2 n=1 Tax=Nocardia goodfellowii TaxID=882446 RepID=A0ABS4QN07_9NOCA|nr:hypothetical protein [Nocardia goodfellowii]MBP2193090.1 hypothetical protein [Nocardia goodfellowii]